LFPSKQVTPQLRQVGIRRGWRSESVPGRRARPGRRRLSRRLQPRDRSLRIPRAGVAPTALWRMEAVSSAGSERVSIELTHQPEGEHRCRGLSGSTFTGNRARLS
jgi:hypothetical protein